MIGTVAPILRSGPGSAADDPLLAPEGRYLVGFDGSQASTMALRWTVDRVRAGAHELVLIGVSGGRDEDRPNQGGPLELTRMLGRRAQDLREHDEVTVSTQQASGDVAAGLVQSTRPGDVLVVGSDKTGFAQGRILGFRSIELAAAVTGIFVVVPAVDLRMRTGVVVGLDEAPRALDLVRIGAREAVRRHSRLLLVHALPPTSGSDRRSRGEHMLAMARHTAWEEGDPEVTTHLVEKRSADAILNFSRDRALLIVGRSGNGRAVGLGPTLHDLLVNTNAPTVVVP
jgi:hypothetical protein